jgi:uncharacterized protein (TIGR02270 family)
MGGELDDLIGEHVQEAAFLWLERDHAVRAPNYRLRQLADLDERIEAHIDGLRVAGEGGRAHAEAAVESGLPEDVFPAAVLALEGGNGRFEALVERLAAGDAFKGLASALGWVEPGFLSGLVKALLVDAEPAKQRLGLAACNLHRRDPGASLERLMASPVSSVRARALRTAGDLGRVDLLPLVLDALADDKREPRFWAARSGVMLGDRARALEQLRAGALTPGPQQLAALYLAVQALDPDPARELLRDMAHLPGGARLRVIGAGLTGNARYVPWLIEQMENRDLARTAGEAFSLITGADLVGAQLEVEPPADFEEGPTENPDDDDVGVPEDLALPWPGSRKVADWWERHRSRFDPGVRYFLGESIGREGCVQVLKDGTQRQRIVAAHHICFEAPGTPLFNTSAPARRQTSLLDEDKEGP